MPDKVLPFVFLALAAACYIASARDDTGHILCGDLGDVFIRGCGDCLTVDIPLNPTNVVMESAKKATITPGTRARIRRARNSNKLRTRDYQGPVEVSQNVTMPTCNACKPGYQIFGDGAVLSMPTTPQPVIDFNPSFCGCASPRGANVTGYVNYTYATKTVYFPDFTCGSCPLNHVPLTEKSNLIPVLNGTTWTLQYVPPPAVGRGLPASDGSLEAQAVSVASSKGGSSGKSQDKGKGSDNKGKGSDDKGKKDDDNKGKGGGDYGSRPGDSNHNDELDHHGNPGDRDCDDAHARWRPDGTHECDKKRPKPDTPDVVDSRPPWMPTECVPCPSGTMANVTAGACVPDLSGQPQERK